MFFYYFLSRLYFINFLLKRRIFFPGLRDNKVLLYCTVRKVQGNEKVF